MSMLNFFKGIFIHKDNEEHYPVETYSGLTCIGYKCHKCGYKWYEKRGV